ncbi:hypothetical protein PanWU01x14_284930 [Parasponia andersonii]|uniref:Non-specific serine/threonine protein kinase n=1 Tax=Parasponia andersonii TaxID=3476 RepID=A0A2P5AZQ0_PARAD|nr:hypothetical protein PanWU01x14_284930 [Parasponia andersonii]
MKGGSRHDIVKCIHIGLLCVQEKVAHRPAVSSVVLLVCSSSLSFQPPSRPAYFTESNCQSGVTESNLSQISSSVVNSENNVSITELYPR